MIPSCQCSQGRPVLSRRHAVPSPRLICSLRSTRGCLHSLKLPRPRPSRRRYYVPQAASDRDRSRQDSKRSDTAAALANLDPLVVLGGSWAAYGSLVAAAVAFQFAGGWMTCITPFTVLEYVESFVTPLSVAVADPYNSRPQELRQFCSSFSLRGRRWQRCCSLRRWWRHWHLPRHRLTASQRWPRSGTCWRTACCRCSRRCSGGCAPLSQQ